MKPYAVLSDIHLHNWSAFATTLPGGVNSRLQQLLSEIRRAWEMLKRQGGSDLVITGDLFHVRGKIAPSVLNPTLDLLTELIKDGAVIHIIPGNHDLEGRDSERVGSAVTSLEKIGAHVYSKTTGAILCDGRHAVMVPWFDSVEHLTGEIQRARGMYARYALTDVDLFIHAPVNGVIMGIPDHGIDAGELARLGFGRVFCGHYHNHKAFPGNVYSVGALAHHTWNDVGSVAGFLIVSDDGVQHVMTSMPQFVDVPAGIDEKDVGPLVKGNYARAYIESSKTADVEALREFLTKQGALGVQITQVKKPVNERPSGTAATPGKARSIEQSVGEFIAGMEGLGNSARVADSALRVLAQANATV